MGCDLFYSGCLPFPELQERIVQYSASAYGKDCLVIFPEDTKLSFERYDHLNITPYAIPESYFGIIPHWRTELFEKSQFIFDRSKRGRLVSFKSIPGQYLSISINNEVQNAYAKSDKIVTVDGGCARDIVSLDFAVFLHIVKLRYWPTLSIVDDYGVFESVQEQILDLRLSSYFKNEKCSFEECQQLLMKKVGNYSLHECAVRSEPTIKVVPRGVENILTDELEVSVRTYNFLRNAGIETVGELLKWSEKELLRSFNVGRKSISELNDILWEYGVHLRND